MTKQFVIELQKSFIEAADSKTAQSQSAYMRNQFAFLGLPKPKRALLQKLLFKKYTIANEHDLKEAILLLWDLDAREFQYVAVDLAIKYKKLFSPTSISFFKTLIMKKSWWDTVDHLAIKLVGFLASKHHHLLPALKDWAKDDCMWVRRTALLFQIQWKKNTLEEVLFGHCQSLMHEKEFFIRKAIGWSLRQYSKVSPQAVKRFIDLHRAHLSPLAIKEGYKYLK